VTGLILLAISYIIPAYPIGVALLSIATVAFYAVHLRRVHDEVWDSWYLQQFGTLLRDHERGAWEEIEETVHNDNNTLRKTAVSNVTVIMPQKYTKRRRRKTEPNLPGAYYFLLGTTLSTLLYNIIVARTALLVLSIADPAAGLVGSWFRIHLPGWSVSWEQLLRTQRGNGNFVADGGPSVIGSIACALTTILCTYVYIPTSNSLVSMTLPSLTMVVAKDRVICLSLGSRLVVGLLTAVTEAMAGKRNIPVIGILLVDDNLLIPLIVGALIYWLS
jgi:dolichol kinase